MNADLPLSTIRFTCPEHGDVALYSSEDDEATCLTRDEVLDLEEPLVQAAIAAAVEHGCRCDATESCDLCV